jgi:DNA replicative helicase MCM subunit Mcm2 (Cdc46/Mcm family)
MRDRLQIILTALIEMEKETGMVEKGSLETELEEKYKISRAEADRLLSQLLREGTIYEPREGYLKKT